MESATPVTGINKINGPFAPSMSCVVVQCQVGFRKSLKSVTLCPTKMIGPVLYPFNMPAIIKMAMNLVNEFAVYFNPHMTD